MKRANPVRSTPKGPNTEPWNIADYTLEKMRKDGVPLTRENYLKRYFGDANYVPDAEQELDMPPQFRRLLPPDPTDAPFEWR